MTLTELARLLGVSTNQVWTWHQRREKNGFPEAIGSVIKPRGGGRRKAPFFDPDEVVRWHQSYDPYARTGEHWHERRDGGPPKNRGRKWQDKWRAEHGRGGR